MIESEPWSSPLYPAEISEEEGRWLELTKLLTEKVQELLDSDNHSLSSLELSCDSLSFFLGLNLYMVRALYEKVHDRFPHIKLESLMVEKGAISYMYTFLKGQTGYMRGAHFIPFAEVNDYLYEEFNLTSSSISKDLSIRVYEGALNEDFAPIVEDYNKVIDYCLGIFYAKEQENQLMKSTKNSAGSSKNLSRL